MPPCRPRLLVLRCFLLSQRTPACFRGCGSTACETITSHIMGDGVFLERREDETEHLTALLAWPQIHVVLRVPLFAPRKPQVLLTHCFS
ncbi:hypothetical protein NDU88_002449 [Pleurodeles waltl]|uniref:Secreted protein n=1 Tax=Pleurodeles waltl TaxID=8319 RepID=A0AAV7U9C1_PLEWA|nr:hypothetical protein NDU88_002449 [Pleurodeles waltl]